METTAAKTSSRRNRRQRKQPRAAHQAKDKVASKPTGDDALLALLRSPAHSDEERFDVLEARDKLMRRAKKGPEHQLLLVGTCPDMCPEKERYSRMDKRLLRSFETSHASMVKEYSRPSADQDAPLPHELRPAPVLQRTMSHLLGNVVDKIEEEGGVNVGEWFEFVWSSTRSLRKDITQQQMTDLAAVGVVERCARFHIMCAGRLVEEQRHDFDPKLNDENLAKCLQTLTHMYEDLKYSEEEEAGVASCEPEFRAYEILMNLNDGDTLRKAQELDERVRNSPEVRFALDALGSVGSNNYVRFFRLVRTRATLLQGCVLLRYFCQVRRSALLAMARAYAQPSRKSWVGLSHFAHLLGFENAQECGQFCSEHGAVCDPDEDKLYLTREILNRDKVTSQQKRARRLVESKRDAEMTWSAVINGGVPPSRAPYTDYPPHDSFDENGILRGDAYEAACRALLKSNLVADANFRTCSTFSTRF